MAQFRQKIGSAPRSIRSIAEMKSAPANFPEDVSFDYEAGAPSAVAGGEYSDSGLESAPKTLAQQQSAGPQPFSALRRGR